MRAPEARSVDFEAVRAALAALPRSASHAPGDPVRLAEVFVPGGHRGALDPERVLVVGNRGVGKSYWAHALADDEVRERIADEYRQSSLRQSIVMLGFNASERSGEVAPTPGTLAEALRSGVEPEDIWRAVLLRAAHHARLLEEPPELTSGFTALCQWIRDSAERFDRLMTSVDDALARSGRRLLLAFDALDRVGTTWEVIRPLTRGLLRRALAARSYRAIRLKVFMRTDQFDDPGLFDFPDASKIKNDRVVLEWEPTDLYGLLLAHLRRSEASEALVQIERDEPLPGRRTRLFVSDDEQRQQRTIEAIAGEFMGASRKRGRVYSWLPLHLGDAKGKASPRTFLTAWREAARLGTRPADKAVDHLGIAEGVRKASADRVAELAEDYRWINLVLEPLRDQMVPMERSTLVGIWERAQTVEKVREQSARSGWLEPVQLTAKQEGGAALLVEALQAIGVLEIRSNGKINVPDIFRVEAGIKRKGGVKPPIRGAIR